MKITQQELVFYKLYKAYKEDPERFVAAWEFVGEIHLKELNLWANMSYKCPANGVEVYFNNPGLIERRKVTGKSGARYYEYRIAPGASSRMIKSDRILALYKQLNPNVKVSEKSKNDIEWFDSLPVKPPQSYTQAVS